MEGCRAAEHREATDTEGFDMCVIWRSLVLGESCTTRVWMSLALLVTRAQFQSEAEQAPQPSPTRPILPMSPPYSSSLRSSGAL